MARGDAYIRIVCDNCGEEIECNLVATAGSGSWDERTVDAQLTREGWHIQGDGEICDMCSPEGD